jgi:hypothetical protein
MLYFSGLTEQERVQEPLVLALDRKSEESADIDPRNFMKGAVGVGILLGRSRDNVSTELKGFSASYDREEFKNIRSTAAWQGMPCGHALLAANHPPAHESRISAGRTPERTFSRRRE